MLDILNCYLPDGLFVYPVSLSPYRHVSLPAEKLLSFNLKNNQSLSIDKLIHHDRLWLLYVSLNMYILNSFFNTCNKFHQSGNCTFPGIM